MQAALMVLEPGQSTGGVENEHPGSEQWLFVISGSGWARVGQRRARLARGSLLVIERREIHQVVNSGRSRLVTLNFYAPPAYRENGEPK